MGRVAPAAHECRVWFSSPWPGDPCMPLPATSVGAWWDGKEQGGEGGPARPTPVQRRGQGKQMGREMHLGLHEVPGQSWSQNSPRLRAGGPSAGGDLLSFGRLPDVVPLVPVQSR